MPSHYLVLRYQTGEGVQPFTEWVEHLRDRQAASMIHARVDRLEGGHFGKVRHIHNEIWKMKLYLGPGYRVYHLRDGEQIIVLLCGGDKGSQTRDIQKAIRYAEDYWRRK